MASPSPAHLDPQSQSQPRIRTPRLKYRTSSYDVESVNTATTVFSHVNAFTNDPSPSPTRSDFCNSPKYPPSDFSTSCSSRPSSIAASSLLPPEASAKSLKKRQSFFSGLFAVKEPSAQALAEYQKQLMKQATAKGGRPTALRVPGVSSATLPADVPKVNSKWDGVPQARKEKDKKTDLGAMNSILTGSRGTSTGRSGTSSETSSLRTTRSRRPTSSATLGGASMYTTHSGGSRNHLADLYGWEITDSAHASTKSLFTDQSRPGTSRSVSGRGAPQSPSKNATILDAQQPPKIPNDYFDQTPPKLPVHSHSPSLTPRDSSPATPDGPSPLVSVNSRQSGKVVSPPEVELDDLRTTTIDAPSSVDEVIIRSSGVNILGPPMSAKRGQRSPALHVPSGNRSQASSGNANLHSILKQEFNASQQSPQLSSHTQSPSPIDKPQRRLSVRDRLGLELRLKHHDHATTGDPSNVGGLMHGGPRELTPTPESGESLLRRRSRLSHFKK